MALELRASALAVLSVFGLEDADPQPLQLQIEEPPVAIASPSAVIPDAEAPTINLDAVRWTVPRREPLGRLAERWGMPADALRHLNPHLRGPEPVPQGERVVVFRQQPGQVSRSVGAPNRGRLQNGVPFPEGRYWRLRAYRHRTFATRTVVADLAVALEAWGERYPNAAPVKLGEFSRRGGGKINPHSSHRTGRDVDIGYVLLDPGTGPRFKRATKSSIDAEATWGLVRALRASDGVERIFMSNSVQRLILPMAIRDLPADELGTWFSSMASGHAKQSRAFLRHWRGHDDHMHVRFECSNVDLNCREAKRRKKRRRRKRRR